MNAQIFLNLHVLAYLLIIVGVQVFTGSYHHFRRERISRKRADAGLPEDVISDQAGELSRIRKEAAIQSAAFLATLFLGPVLVVFIDDPDARKGLTVTFATLFLWLMLTGTDVLKAFLGGMAFRTLLAFTDPIQVGDRVTIGGTSGKVIRIGTFFVVLQTLDDNQVSIPTNSLWSQVLSSSNAGERSSLCVMDFYLASFVGRDQLRGAEEVIREAIQASPYMELSKPVQIYFSQTSAFISLTAKAYVASTYNGPLFRSDVTRAFLEFTLENGIPLASSEWRVRGSGGGVLDGKSGLEDSESRADGGIS